MSNVSFPVDLTKLDVFGKHHAGGVIGLTLLVTEWNYNAIDPKQLYWLLKGLDRLDGSVFKTDKGERFEEWVASWDSLWDEAESTFSGVEMRLDEDEKSDAFTVICAVCKRLRQFILIGSDRAERILITIRGWFREYYDHYDIPQYFKQVAWSWIVEDALGHISGYFRDDILKLYVRSKESVSIGDDPRWTQAVSAMSQVLGYYFLDHCEHRWLVCEKVSHVDFIESLLVGWYILEMSPERYLRKCELDERLELILMCYKDYEKTMLTLPTRSLFKEWEDLKYIHEVYGRIRSGKPPFEETDTIIVNGEPMRVGIQEMEEAQ